MKWVPQKPRRGKAANFRLRPNLTHKHARRYDARRFLAAEAAQAAVGWQSRSACASRGVPQAATTPKHRGPDRVWLIEAQRQAGLDHDAHLSNQARLEQIGDPAPIGSEEHCHAEFSALDVLLAAPGTTSGTSQSWTTFKTSRSRDEWRFVTARVHNPPGRGLDGHRETYRRGVMKKKSQAKNEMISSG